ncbi:hypothetical protein P7C71_g162, partial [Lecanoromycetidae sp. Uapishka_2]
MATNGIVPPETEAALVVWVNSFSLSSRVESLSEMNDGQALWEMLCEINPDSFNGDLPSKKQSDYSRQQNLQFIYAKVVSYLDEHGAGYQSSTEQELKKLAAGGSSSSTIKARYEDLYRSTTVANRAVKFLKLVLLVVIVDPPQVHVIAKLSTLPAPTQKVMASLIQEIDTAQYHSDDEDSSDHDNPNNSNISSPSRKIDRELALEEHLAKVRSQLEHREMEAQDLKAEKAEIGNEYLRLQEKYDDLSKLSIEQEGELRRLNSKHNETKQISVRDLDIKISHQEETISRHEAQIAEHQLNEAELERKYRKLREVDDKLQNLQDNFDEQKVKLEEQTRKANQADNYKRKLQASQSIEKERDSLRQQLDEARPNLQHFEDIRKENAKLQQQNHEIGQTLSRSERDNTELRETKQAYLAEIDRLQRDSKALREVLAQGQERITELEDAGNSENHSSPTLVDGGLESELAETSKQEEEMQVACTVLFWTRVLMSDRKNRILDLEKQLRQMTSDATEQHTKFTSLQRQLGDAQERSTSQYEQFLETRQEVSSLQSSLAEVRGGHPIEGSVSPSRITFDVAHNLESTEAFKRVREQLQVERKKRAELEQKLSAAQRDVNAANNDRMSSFERHCMMTDLSIDLLEGELCDKPKLQMVDEVKRQHSVALMQLQSEHDALRSRYTLLQQHYDRQNEERNQAWQESHEAVVANAELQTKTNAQSEKQANVIKNLQARLNQQSPSDITKNNSTMAEESRNKITQSAEERSYTQNLERENKLIASAFYDFSGRLQMDSVVLQRRAEAPKSWLGRQRKATEGVGGLVR